MSKPTKRMAGPDYSREREFKVILEDLRSQFRVFGEGLIDVRDRLGRVEDRLTHVEDRLTNVEMRLTSIEGDVAEIKSAFRPFTFQVIDHENRLRALEKTR